MSDDSDSKPNMTVVQGDFRKKDSEVTEEKKDIKDILLAIAEEVDLSDCSDLVILAGSEEKTNLISNTDMARTNFLIDRAKSSVLQ